MDMTLTDELSQVVFIYDYLQLVFQRVHFTLLTPPTLTSGGRTYRYGESGFCDELVGLISSRATAAEHNDQDDLTITFATGASISVATTDPRATGPEAWQYVRDGVLEFIALTR
jgi:hypothetical protein